MLTQTKLHSGLQQFYWHIQNPVKRSRILLSNWSPALTSAAEYESSMRILQDLDWSGQACLSFCRIKTGLETEQGPGGRISNILSRTAERDPPPRCTALRILGTRRPRLILLLDRALVWARFLLMDRLRAQPGGSDRWRGHGETEVWSPTHVHSDSAAGHRVSALLQGQLDVSTRCWSLVGFCN